MQPLVRTIAYIAVTLVIVGASAWVFLAVFYSDLWPKLAGKLLAGHAVFLGQFVNALLAQLALGSVLEMLA